MQFRVNPAATTAPITFDPALGTALRAPMVRLPGTPLGPVVTGANVQLTRQLTLNEVMGPPQIVQDPVTGVMNTAYPGGPLEVVLNNTKWSGKAPDGSIPAGFIEYPDAGSYGPVYYSELPDEGKTEQWEIINITADAHPIHLHLVQFQIMNRQNFNFNKYMNAYAAAFGGVVLEAFGPPNDYLVPNADNAVGGNPAIGKYLQGKAIPPAAEEQGWKDTVISYPGQVLRLSVRWAPTDLPNTTAHTNAWFPFDPNGGHGYVWHCHIIDHEDNEMMRPTSVIPNPNAVRTVINY
jgi:spore coat protein A